MFKNGLKKFLSIENNDFKKKQKEEQFDQIRLEEYRTGLQ
jgi:hypothetical protein